MPPAARFACSPRWGAGWSRGAHALLAAAVCAVGAGLAEIGREVSRDALDRVRTHEGLEPDRALDELHEFQRRRFDREPREIDIGNELVGRARLDGGFGERGGMDNPEPRGLK